jgi:hypothetical protein
MANLVSTGNGFIPLEPDVSANHIVYAYVPASDGTALGIGSPVKKVGSSNAAAIKLSTSNRVAGATDLGIGQLPTVTHALDGATDKVWGVVVGVMVDHNDYTAIHHRPASTEAVVKIARVLPGRKFRVRSDAAVPAASVGLNVNMSAGASVSALGFSTAVVDGGNAAADATYQFKIVAIGRDPNQSDVTAAGVELIVEGNVGYDVVADAGL